MPIKCAVHRVFVARGVAREGSVNPQTRYLTALRADKSAFRARKWS